MTHSFPVTLSRTYARSKYSKDTMILYNVDKFSVLSRSAEVVYSRTSSSKFIALCGVGRLSTSWQLATIYGPPYGQLAAWKILHRGRPN